ncbi:MAG: hypothetical protein SFX73_38200, partial [Kofleriaceae bacterium]|nr:hypothetical protein [Kofleriaceae bacterium]
RFGVAVATIFGLVGLPLFFSSVQPVLDADIKMLKSMHAPITRVVRVTCDADPYWLGEVRDSKGRVDARIALCEMGKHVLPVRVDGRDDLPGRTLQGRLSWIDAQVVWAGQAFAESPELEARAFQVYVSQQSDRERIAMAVLGALFILLGPVAWVVYFRWRRRTKAAA